MVDNIADKTLRKPPIEEEAFVDLFFKYIYIILKYKILIILAVLLVAPIAFRTLKAREPVFQPKYKTTARIRVMAEGIVQRSGDTANTIYAEDMALRRKVMDLTNLMKSSVVLENAVEKTFNLTDKDQIVSYASGFQDPKSEVFIVTEEMNYINMSIIESDPKVVVDFINAVIEFTREELLNSKRLVAKEALESLEKQLKEARYDLEQAKLQLTKFIVENKVLSEAMEVEEGKIKGTLTEDVDKLALQLVDIRSQRAGIEEFIADIKDTRDTRGEVEAFRLVMRKHPELVNADLLNDLSKQEAELKELLLVNKEAHPDVVKAAERLEQAKRLIQNEINAATDSLVKNNDTLNMREEKMSSLIEKGLSDVMIEYSHLQRNVRIKENLADKVVDSLQELSLATKLISTGTFTVVDPPLLPAAPFNLYEKQRTTVNFLLFSLIFGLAAGIGLAAVIEQLSTTVRDLQEIEKSLDYSILGEIPLYKASHKGSKYSLPLKEDPNCIVSEAFRGLRTNIKFRCADKEIKTILITSLVPKEGKTFISSSLAVAFAQTGKDVLIIDCDLRKSTLHKYYGVENKNGITQLVQGEEGIQPVNAGIPHLDILPAGKHAQNPAELLSSDAFDKILKELKQKYDLIIIDSAPLFAVTDSTILIKKSDIAILAIRADVTPKKAIRRLARFSEDIYSKILGVVFNGIGSQKSRYGSYYYYKYNYYGKGKG
ncbi:MAG: polysaccharide biosynthesis tyrosine autokinase [Candidatus Omnitrophota bacterium]